ncbi:DUF6734 family protein [Chryseobacterium shigense]|uniref:DUF6734 domain-containing protein n=1 Tax=Chryseobacterium shigense TaxID=297244 RepID=A0A841NDX5_9FLAO|nr:DUF6734 family protein [Chryseobacterium shigense]MBB6371520.1 hypothetical protein [Chryseobacterium shigense]
MKIIQSFWTASQDFQMNSFGWLYPRFHVIGWALSCLQLSKFYDVELYTDKNGYDLLITKLGLPYKKVHVVMDELNTFHRDFWALPKIKAYMLQNEPFLHVDGDVFIWEPFPDNLMSEGLISQNLEITTEYYSKMWDEIFPHLKFIPAEMEKYISKVNNYACNMGIFGGNDINFINRYSQKSFEFAAKNSDLHQGISGGNFNIFFEQVLLFEMMTEEKKNSAFLIQEVPLDNDYIGFGNFDEVPFKRTYLHLLGHYKRIYSVCKLMETFFINNYPSLFSKIYEMFPDEYPLLGTVNYTFSHLENKERRERFLEDARQDTYNEIFDEVYLFNRDLTCINLHPFLFECLNNDRNFNIKRIKGSIYSQEEDQAILTIRELNEEKTIIPIDEIDQLILDKAEVEKTYYSLRSEILEMLDDEAAELKDEFITMIQERLNYYLKNKLIVVYSV